MKTETSQSSPIGLNYVVPPNERGGWVAITLAPGKQTQGHSCYWKRDLGADLDRLCELGATVLVPLLTDDELEALKIPGLVEQAKERGLDVRRFPFHDGGVPGNMPEAVLVVKEIYSRRFSGDRIVVHCNGGLGRAGMIAACVRLAVDLDEFPDQAIASVRRIRGRRAIETREQEEFVERFQDAWEDVFAPATPDLRGRIKSQLPDKGRVLIP